MKRIAALLVVFTIVALPMTAGAQTTTTRTAFQVVNMDQDDPAEIIIQFYDQDGNSVFSVDDTINAAASKTYIQADMGDDPPDGLGSVFDGSAVIRSNREIAAIVNQNTSDSHDNYGNATRGYNGSYTGLAEGSDTFYIPIVLNSFYGYHTVISIQNVGGEPVDVTIDYDTSACSDQAMDLAEGAAVRFDNRETCAGGLNPNGSAIVSATGPVVAVVNQIGDTSPNENLEQTYNGFAPVNASNTLYAPIALHNFYGFNSGIQVQNISGDTMDICATYSDDLRVCKLDIADAEAATFLQENEAHVANWTGSAVITNTTGGLMVGIVNQQSGLSAASFNMATLGARRWVLPSLLYQYYGFTSSFQVQNVSDGSVDVVVTYDDGATARVDGVGAGGVATFIQANEVDHTSNVAFSAVVEAIGGDIVVVVNQDAINPQILDYQYSYNPMPRP
jgi:hypothetical protein